jgi:hypothetical protein
MTGLLHATKGASPRTTARSINISPVRERADDQPSKECDEQLWDGENRTLDQ